MLSPVTSATFKAMLFRRRFHLYVDRYTDLGEVLHCHCCYHSTCRWTFTMDDALLHRNTLYSVRPILRFPGEHQELRRCVCCRGKVRFRTFLHGRGPKPIRWTKVDHIIQCACSSCVYCSEKCRRDDRLEHGARCDNIVKTFTAIQSQVPLLTDTVEAFVGLVDSSGRDYFDTQSEYAIGEGSKSCWKDYFLLRQQLIEQLINEGIARTDGNGKTIQNELALNTAIFHCQQLFKIDKYDSYYSHVEGLIPRKEILMNLYLITGRYQELYNTCCFYT